jgi:hypothetical protein
MLWKRTLIEHHELWKDYTTEDAIVVTKKKTKTMKAQNNKFLLKKTVQVLCMPSQDLLQSQGNHERDCGYDMKGWEGVQSPKIQILEKPKC